MTDVTAQHFRDAADGCTDLEWRALLLAAAEQREQRDEARIERDGVLALLSIAQQQVAMLTAEHAGVDGVVEMLREGNRSLQAERDEARALLEQVREWAKAFAGYAVSHNAVSGYFDKLWSILYVTK